MKTPRNGRKIMVVSFEGVFVGLGDGFKLPSWKTEFVVKELLS